MDLNKITLFQLANKRMGYLSERQRVLSENVANANTPGFVPRDLKPMDFRNIMRSEMTRLQPAVTNTAHMTRAAQSGSVSEKRDRGSEIFETSPDGNSVSLEQQMMKVADTQAQYGLTANLYQKHLSMLRTAIGHS
ncbi:MAG: flagellar basal body rod protein FlgB [Proteobacteria bacterium]|nr:flagellar basal body rod protein FlgB [Pseudomonadota bacterium]MBI3497223.1 flagellar basal body rod protein FlgB [Pseudomonadota bacterium]